MSPLLQLLTVLPLLYSFACANVFPRATTIVSYHNVSSTYPSLPTTTPKCCFLVQDTVSQVWWEQTKYESTIRNITSFSTFITAYPNMTVVNVNSTVTVTTIVSSELNGLNPISLIGNDAPGPAETTATLNVTGAITTGTAVIQSPAAFYVYNTIRIITADAVTDGNGNVQCGIRSVGDSDSDNFDYGIINSNAQAYFSESAIKLRSVEASATFAAPDPISITATISITPAPSPVAPTVLPTAPSDGSAVAPTPTVLSLTDPFIYVPAHGSAGATFGDACRNRESGTEDFGYIPQTLLSSLVNNQYYISQYPALTGCLAGGPSISLRNQLCYYSTTRVAGTAIGGDLTTSTVVYVTPPGISKPKPSTGGDPGSAVPIVDDQAGRGGNDDKGEGDPNTNDNNRGGSSSNNGGTNGGSNSNSNGNQNSNNGGNSNPGSSNSLPQNNGGSQDAPIPVDASIGDIINQIIGGPRRENPGQSGQQNTKPNNIVFPSATEIPVANAPPGVTGPLKTVGGTPVFVIAAPTTVAAPSVLPFGAGTVGSTRVIGGTPYIVVPGPTNIPLSAAPAGIQGTYTKIDGTDYIVIPGTQTYAAPNSQITGAAVWGHGKPTTIAGVPFIVYPKTEIPLLEASVYGITNTAAAATKTINGTPYLELSGPTTVPAREVSTALAGARTTLVNGTPLLILPSSTPIPLSLFPSGIANAITTSISGSAYLILPSQTSVPLPINTNSPASQQAGQLTVIIDGKSNLIIAGPKTIPVNSDFDIEGSKTVIGGTTMVIVTGPTTVVAKTKSSTSNTTSSEASRTPTPALPAPTEQAPRSGAGRMESSFVVGAAAVVLFGFVF